MLTRWAVQHTNKLNSLKCKLLILAPISPELDAELDWPTLSDIKKAQNSSDKNN